MQANAVPRKFTFSVKKGSTAEVMFTAQAHSLLFSCIFIRLLNAQIRSLENWDASTKWEQQGLCLRFSVKTSLSVNMLLMKTHC